ncbi:hypothetical protein PWT90_02034 [Aphanocladium album]|nr:hypothetical protein PWT90_02034 [Aphanocladium album]
MLAPTVWSDRAAGHGVIRADETIDADQILGGTIPAQLPNRHSPHATGPAAMLSTSLRLPLLVATTPAAFDPASFVLTVIPAFAKVIVPLTAPISRRRQDNTFSLHKYVHSLESIALCHLHYFSRMLSWPPANLLSFLKSAPKVPAYMAPEHGSNTEYEIDVFGTPEDVKKVYDGLLSSRLFPEYVFASTSEQLPKEGPIVLVASVPTCLHKIGDLMAVKDVDVDCLIICLDDGKGSGELKYESHKKDIRAFIIDKNDPHNARDQFDSAPVTDTFAAPEIVTLRVLIPPEFLPLATVLCSNLCHQQHPPSSVCPSAFAASKAI